MKNIMDIHNFVFDNKWRTNTEEIRLRFTPSNRLRCENFGVIYYSSNLPYCDCNDSSHCELLPKTYHFENSLALSELFHGGIIYSEGGIFMSFNLVNIEAVVEFMNAFKQLFNKVEHEFLIFIHPDNLDRITNLFKADYLENLNLFHEISSEELLEFTVYSLSGRAEYL